MTYDLLINVDFLNRVICGCDTVQNQTAATA